MHWCSLNCEPCLLHSSRQWFCGCLITLDSQGKPTRFLFWQCKHAMFSFFSCSTFVGKVERTANGTCLGKNVSVFFSATLILLIKKLWVHSAVNSLQSSSTLNSVLEYSGLLNTKIKLKGRW